MISEPLAPVIARQSTVHAVVFGLFVAQCFLVCTGLCTSAGFVNGRWSDGLLLLFAVLTTLSCACRQLPAQNVILASALILAIAAIIIMFHLPGLDFGANNISRAAPWSLHPLSWAFPLVWLVFIFNSRGVARLVLQPWRHSPNYGFWVLGLTAFLTAGLDISFQPFATVVRNYWTWPSVNIGFTWYGTPWANFVTIFITTLFILLAVTTSLISKSPVPRAPSLQPLVIWELLSLLFATGAVAHRLWGAAGFAAGQALILGGFVIYSRMIVETKRGRS